MPLLINPYLGYFNQTYPFTTENVLSLRVADCPPPHRARLSTGPMSSRPLSATASTHPLDSLRRLGPDAEEEGAALARLVGGGDEEVAAGGESDAAG